MSEWTKWRENEFTGCPVPLGVEFEIRGFQKHVYTYAGGIMCSGMMEGSYGYTWLRTPDDFEGTWISSYRIRKPLGIAVLQEIVTNPVKELEPA